MVTARLFLGDTAFIRREDGIASVFLEVIDSSRGVSVKLDCVNAPG